MTGCCWKRRRNVRKKYPCHSHSIDHVKKNYVFLIRLKLPVDIFLLLRAHNSVHGTLLFRPSLLSLGLFDKLCIMSPHIVPLNRDVDRCLWNGFFYKPRVLKPNSHVRIRSDSLLCGRTLGRAQCQQSSPVFLHSLSVLSR